MGENKTLGQFIAMRRKYMRLSQEELAEKIGVSKSAIAKWETDGGLPDRDNIKRIAEVINVSVGDLYRIIESEGIKKADLEVNITPDVITALESYGYRVIRPDEDNKEA